MQDSPALNRRTSNDSLASVATERNRLQVPTRESIVLRELKINNMESINTRAHTESYPTWQTNNPDPKTSDNRYGSPTNEKDETIPNINLGHLLTTISTSPGKKFRLYPARKLSLSVGNSGLLRSLFRKYSEAKDGLNEGGYSSQLHSTIYDMKNEVSGHPLNVSEVKSLNLNPTDSARCQNSHINNLMFQYKMDENFQSRRAISPTLLETDAIFTNRRSAAMSQASHREYGATTPLLNERCITPNRSKTRLQQAEENLNQSRNPFMKKVNNGAHSIDPYDLPRKSEEYGGRPHSSTRNIPPTIDSGSTTSDFKSPQNELKKDTKHLNSTIRSKSVSSSASNQNVGPRLSMAILDQPVLAENEEPSARTDHPSIASESIHLDLRANNNFATKQSEPMGNNNRFDWKEFSTRAALAHNQFRYADNCFTKDLRELDKCLKSVGRLQANPTSGNSNAILQVEYNSTILSPARSCSSNKYCENSLSEPRKQDITPQISKEQPLLDKEALVKKITAQVSSELDRIFESFKKKGRCTVSDRSMSVDRDRRFSVNDSGINHRRIEESNINHFNFSDIKSIYLRSPKDEMRSPEQSFNKQSPNFEDKLSSADKILNSLTPEMREKQDMRTNTLEIGDFWDRKEKMPQSHEAKTSLKSGKYDGFISDFQHVVERPTRNSINKGSENEKESSEKTLFGDTRGDFSLEGNNNRYLLVPKGADLPQIDESRNEILETESVRQLSAHIDDAEANLLKEETDDITMAADNLIPKGNNEALISGPEKLDAVLEAKFSVYTEFFTPRHEESVNYEAMFLKKQSKCSSPLKPSIVVCEEASQQRNNEEETKGKTATRYAQNSEKINACDASLSLINSEEAGDTSLQHALTFELQAQTSRSSPERHRSVKSEPNLEGSATTHKDREVPLPMIKNEKRTEGTGNAAPLVRSVNGFDHDLPTETESPQALGSQSTLDNVSMQPGSKKWSSSEEINHELNSLQRINSDHIDEYCAQLDSRSAFQGFHDLYKIIFEKKDESLDPQTQAELFKKIYKQTLEKATALRESSNSSSSNIPGFKEATEGLQSGDNVENSLAFLPDGFSSPKPESKLTLRSSECDLEIQSPITSQQERLEARHYSNSMSKSRRSYDLQQSKEKTGRVLTKSVNNLKDSQTRKQTLVQENYIGDKSPQRRSQPKVPSLTLVNPVKEPKYGICDQQPKNVAPVRSNSNNGRSSTLKLANNKNESRPNSRKRTQTTTFVSTSYYVLPPSGKNSLVDDELKEEAPKAERKQTFLRNQKPEVSQAKKQKDFRK